MTELPYRMYYRDNGQLTFFRKYKDGSLWCTHGNWECVPNGNSVYDELGLITTYDGYKDLTVEEYTDNYLRWVQRLNCRGIQSKEYLCQIKE